MEGSLFSSHRLNVFIGYGGYYLLSVNENN